MPALKLLVIVYSVDASNTVITLECSEFSELSFSTELESHCKLAGE